MKALVLGKSVTCDLDGDRTYDRCVAICHLEGADISETLVRQGRARDCPQRRSLSRDRAGGGGSGRDDPTDLSAPGYCER
jgi:endonuclease YncB( thermonuclease family)